MNITKVASFSEEDQKVLVAAGEFLGQLKKVLLNNEVDRLDTKASDLVLAIADVVNSVNTILYPNKVNTEENE